MQNDSSQTFESTWQEVKLSLEWQHTFQFYVVLSKGNSYTRELKECIKDFAREKVKSVIWLQPKTIDEAIEAFLPTLFKPTKLDEAQPIWVNLAENPNTPQADEQRNQIFSYLNQRRGRIEHDCPSPVFFEVPPGYASQLVTVCPDLWTIREKVITIPEEGKKTPLQNTFDEFLPYQSIVDNFGQLDQTEITDKISSKKLRVNKLEKQFANPRSQRELYHEYIDIALLKSSLGDHNAATIFVQKAFHLLINLDPTNEQPDQYLLELAYGFHIASQIFHSSNSLDSARTCSLYALNTYQTLESSDYIKDYHLRLYALILYQLAFIYEDFHDFESSQQYAAKSFEVFKAIQKASQSNKSNLYDLASISRLLSSLALEKGMLSEATAYSFNALNYLEQALKINKQANPQHNLNLAASFIKYSQILVKEGKFDSAKTYLNKTINIAVELQNKSIVIPDALSHLAYCNSQLSILSYFNGMHQDALNFAQEALKISKSLVDSFNRSTNTLKQVANATTRLVQLHQETDITTAEAYALNLLSICEEIHTLAGNTISIRGLSFVYTELAHINYSKKNLLTAQAFAHKAFEQISSLNTILGNSPNTLGELIKTRYWQALIAQGLNNTSEANTHFLAAFHSANECVQKFPEGFQQWVNFKEVIEKYLTLDSKHRPYYSDASLQIHLKHIENSLKKHEDSLHLFKPFM